MNILMFVDIYSNFRSRLIKTTNSVAKKQKKNKKRAAQTTQEWTKATMAGKQKIN